jgi:hypothetical protein
MSAACHNHPGIEASGHCVGCAEPFCGNCLLELDGSLYCGSCKVLALRGRTPMLESGMSPSQAATQAMTIAMVGFFCFGIILGPVAIVKAIGARKEIRENVMLSGWGKANAALAIGIFVLIMSVLDVIARVAS